MASSVELRWRPWLLLPLALVAAVLGALLAKPFFAARATPAVANLRLTPMPTLSGRVDFSLRDAQGQLRSLADFRGKILVLYFGFVRCPDACPTELVKMSQLMKELGAAAGQVQVLLVTLDPERDTPEILDNYVKAFDARFRSLSGSASEIAQAAKAFFVVYSKHPLGNDYTIDHSTGTYVIDVDRREVLYATASTPTADFAHDIRELLAQKR